MNRRDVIRAGTALAAMVAAPRAFALNDAQAAALVNRVVAEINGIINSGRSESAMLGQFEQVFRRYADVPNVARATLGPDARSASQSQLNAFSEAFAVYLSRKYGRRFREFIGGEIQVIGAKQVKRWHEVETVAKLPGQAPFSVVFRVSDRSGRDLFFDIVIEGISLVRTEQTEIGAILDKNRGSIDGMIQDLRRRS
ncbi:MlaC/ttg2D family ABC transporter substrate-binding protein [Ovoidimarina sediminis]|uniref:MlaC/ttg2D family ABC transporter substrate-binding protein n=1 Tax=Ovoidimarina sediminis TaxID=3079856 RepID=UPI00291274D8|nr:ABC transporter substrate-binding protein [Rhodophyticola sp. MJ-SS7]MDU8943940.1 ABC transporter substrate-binding protein [Rhodophyticola sp. MJ-SS7]